MVAHPINAEHYLTTRAITVNNWIKDLVTTRLEGPDSLQEAVAYALQSGGKRLRPIMAIAVAENFDRPIDDIRDAALAIECIHTYSLIHDDLPAMDDDNLRRGLPTLHVQYDEAMAILAGDYLQALAFQLLSRAPLARRFPQRTLAAMTTLAARCGGEGLVGGQVLDLQLSGEALDPEDVSRIHGWKTAALFMASVELPALLLDLDPVSQSALTRFGWCFGHAFQIVDDILDLTQTPRELGKTPGKDERHQRPSMARVAGLEIAHQLAATWTARATDCIRPADPKGIFRAIVEFVLERSA